MSTRPGGWSGRAFRLLLRAYPRWFRDLHAAEMEELFFERLARSRRAGRTVRLWSRAVADSLTTSMAIRRSRVAASLAQTRAGGLTMWWQDLKYGLRQLIRTPMFTVGACTLLAVGIGANVAVFTVLDRLLIRTPPYAQPDRVVQIFQDSDDGEPSSNAFPAYRDMAASGVFEAVAATSPETVRWDTVTGPVSVAVEFTTASYLDVVGLQMERGRWFGPEDDRVGGDFVAVVSAPAWRTRFGSDPDIVGRTVRLNGQTVTIIGVGPRRLSGSQSPAITDFWLSISGTRIDGEYRVANLDVRDDHWYEVLARLPAATTVPQAQAAMHALAVGIGERFPNSDRGRDITLRPVADVRAFEEAGAPLTFALAITLTLLVLSGANLANLLLVRGLSRSGEVAVRRALGAGPGRITRLYFVESLLLSSIGGLLGIGLSRLAISALPGAPLPPPLSGNLDLGIDGRIAMFSVALMLLTGVCFGLAPALHALGRDVATALRDDRRTTTIGRGTIRLRNLLVVIQVAGSVVLILAAGLLGRSLTALSRIDTGVDPDRVAWVRPNLADAGLPDGQAAPTLEAIRTRIGQLPGVIRAAYASRLPAQRSGTTTTVIEGYSPEAGTGAVELNFLIVSPEYCDTMGLRVLEGRGFVVTDVGATDRVVLVNEAAARRFWAPGAAVGGRLRSQAANAPFRTVIGVVEDSPVNAFPERPTRPMFYFPAISSGGYILARTDLDPGTLVAAMRQAVGDVRASVTVPSAGTLASHFGEALARPRFIVTTMSIVSLLAVVLAGLGIYAVVSFNAARRSNELGIRMALGATAPRVVRLVVRDTLTPVVVGLIAGVGLAGLLAPRLQPVLYDVSPFDPGTFAAAVMFFVIVAALAAYLPARRAATADPCVTLRAS